MKCRAAIIIHLPIIKEKLRVLYQNIEYTQTDKFMPTLCFDDVYSIFNTVKNREAVAKQWSECCVADPWEY